MRGAMGKKKGRLKSLSSGRGGDGAHGVPGAELGESFAQAGQKRNVHRCDGYFRRTEAAVSGLQYLAAVRGK